MRVNGCGLVLGLVLAGCASPRPVVVARDEAPGAGATRIAVPVIARPAQEDAAWWFRSGAASAHAHGAGRARARNLILFVGDGMSLPTVAAARILEGQRAGGAGEEHRLSFE